MSEITIINESNEGEKKNFSKGYLAIPFEGEQFREFIAGLLGKPQTITKTIVGTFELYLKDLQSFNDLVMQRVTQQNNGTLIQFTSKIYFNDNSTVQLGSYDELISYNEIKPIVSEAVRLNWEFLIQFGDKKHPEKQSIELLISSSSGIFFEDGDLHITTALKHSIGVFRINIQHTARSWGSDIENMLSNQIESHLIKPNAIRTYIKNNSEEIGVIGGLLFFLSTIIGSFLISQAFINAEIEKVKHFTNSQSHSLNQQVDYLISYIASGVSTQHYFKVSIFLLISLVVSIGFLAYISRAASKNHYPSFIVLTRKSAEFLETAKKELKHNWRVFLSSVLIAIITGIISNFIFQYIIS